MYVTHIEMYVYMYPRITHIEMKPMNPRITIIIIIKINNYAT